MEEIKDPMKELNSQRNSEAFLQMADDIIDDGFDQPETVQQSEPKIKTIDMHDRNRGSLKEQTSNSLPQGPKYLTALENVIGMADIRSIEVELPTIRIKVEVSPLSGKEEQTLRTAAVSPETFLKKINELLFNHTRFANKEFGSFNEFLMNLYPPDKSVLMWALMAATYLTLPTVEKECEECKKKYLVDANPSDLMHPDTISKIWDKELSPNDYIEVQEVLDGYLHFELGMPSERDRLMLSRLIQPEKAKDNIEKTGGLLSYSDNLSFFTKVIIVGEDQDKIVMTDVLQDIHPFLNNVPPKVVDAIKSNIDLTIFDKYMPNFYLETACTHCGAEEKITVDPEIAFFRKAISL
jgi:hypothetical protein